MKFRHHIVLTVGLAAILVCFSVGNQALAQVYAPLPPPPVPGYYQPPSMAPCGPSMYYGPFYISGGAKVRDLQTFRVETHSTQIITIIDPGSPAFGQQNANGPVLYPPNPTGASGTAPDSSGIWAYDDGYIEPTGGGTATDILYPSGQSPGLGLASGGANVGSFQIFDFRVQANDQGAGAMSNTSALSWSKLLTGLAPSSTNGLNALSTLGAEPAPGDPYYTEVASTGFGVTTDAGIATDFQNRVWGPYFEFGFQASGLFDWFTALSVFQTSQTFASTSQTAVGFARRGYQDTYAFYSSDPASWTILNFNSTGGTAGQTYKIYPNDTSGHPIPHRVFFAAIDPDQPATPAQGTVSGKLDLTTWESKTGGRTWVPLWGMGRFGISLGGLFAYSSQTLTSNAIFVATAANDALPIPVAVGDVLITGASQTDGSGWNWGLFTSSDIEIGWRRFFGKAVLEYDWYFYGNTVDTDVLSAKINLSGVGATFLAGVRF